MTVFITAPTVTLIARPQFIEPQHLRCDWAGDQGTDGVRLAEYAGRVCYLSYHNPARRSSVEYITNILKQGHGSVFEHANYSMLLEGISRSCSHELVRHRAGWAYSQQSQRYVDEADCAFVVPPAVLDGSLQDYELWRQEVEQAQRSYAAAVDRLMQQHEGVADRVARRKMAREAARSLLPNATETKIVATANVRAWRTMLELRCGKAADREIRRMATACLRVLQSEAPEFFSDFCITPDGLGGDCAVPEYRKV